MEKLIDLILVFYYLCYEGNVDLDSIVDLNERHALEVQIMEFGQIPKQVFKVPHPKRKVGLKLLLEPDQIVPEKNEKDGKFTVQTQLMYPSHKSFYFALLSNMTFNRLWQKF